ncbi:MFS transporter [Corynebacterium poyangense]|uniref:MFS transporter n=2 Tax=Corynebacterium poyangense TaxID=2684405 RepID=A0A7H0SL60_9CORY|nr:MFS transporter [Corynebacterium poyangense]
MQSWMRVSLAVFIIAAGANIFAPLLPVYRLVDGLSEPQVTFLLAIYIFGLIPALILGGPASDRYGRRALIRPAMILSLLGTSITAIAHFFGPTWLATGRLLTGVAVGFVMSSGASWIKELSKQDTIGARRATVASSSGFAIGPLVGGIVAQWIPYPDVWPLMTHLIGVLILLPVVWNAPQSATSGDLSGPHKQARLLPKTAGHPHFLGGVAAWAPWVFGCATTSFAVIPLLVSVEHTIAFSGFIAALTMLMGVLVQPFVRRVKMHPATFGLLLACAGMVIMFIVSQTGNVWISLLAAMTLGGSYGVMMVSGLQEVQTIARPEELGALTGVYYSLTYIGFFAPFVISFLAHSVGYSAIFLFGIVVTLGSIVPVRWAAQRALNN